MTSLTQKLSGFFNSLIRVKTVSLAADPLDLRPAADAIMAAIEKRAKKSRPIVVLMGEEHNSPSHAALRQMVMARLLNSSSRLGLTTNGNRRFSYGMELPHNDLERWISKKFDTPIPDSLHGKINSADTDGQRFLRVSLAAVSFFGAPVTSNNLLSFCLQQHISSQPNDVAEGDNDHLDHVDPATRDMMERYAPDCDGDLSFDDVRAIVPRNRMIVQHALEHMERTGAGIYVQHCGLDHIFGNKDFNDKFSDSLSALFTTAGVDVLPVFISIPDYGTSIIPEDAHALLKRGLVIKDASHLKFNDKSRAGAEAAFLEALKSHSGGEIGILPTDPGLRDQVAADIPLWIAQAKVQNTPAPR